LEKTAFVADAFHVNAVFDYDFGVAGADLFDALDHNCDVPFLREVLADEVVGASVLASGGVVPNGRTAVKLVIVRRFREWEFGEWDFHAPFFVGGRRDGR
jgi:hypothetical protein